MIAHSEFKERPTKGRREPMKINPTPDAVKGREIYLLRAPFAANFARWELFGAAFVRCVLKARYTHCYNRPVHLRRDAPRRLARERVVGPRGYPLIFAFEFPTSVIDFSTAPSSFLRSTEIVTHTHISHPTLGSSRPKARN